jgi:nitrate/TMAO reductase-like tetraheme cytochrome c subunit
VTSRTVLLRHPVALAGILLTTISATLFVVLVIALFAGLFPNPYAGVLVFVAVPALFVLGLLLIPLGMWLEWRRHRHRGAAVREWPVIDFSLQRTRRWTLLIVGLTVVNLIIVSLAAGGTMHTMDTPGFCGQTCHEPMEPEYVAWQGGPHAHVTCTACHVGEGARALVRSKLAGTRQLYHVLVGHVPRPIKGADMRPALETCGNCHSVGRNHGEVTVTKREYADDEQNTETMSVLQMMVGGPGRKTSTGRSIHWHADPDVQIEFVATDADRQTIPYVRVVNRNGTVKEYKAEGTTDDQLARGERRVMDCIDCHNTPGHRISPTAEQAVDAAIASGDVSRQLPFIRREGVRLVKAEYPTQERGLESIEKELRAFYADKKADQGDLARSIASIQSVYRHNVFPSMKVTFGVYPNNLGHITSNGCFRCHDDGHMAADGTTISGECEYCHVQK